MDAENMFKISVDLYKTVYKEYPKFKFPEYLSQIMFLASENIFKSSDIVKKKGSCYNMKKELNIIHLYKSFNSISGYYSKLFEYNSFHSSYYGTHIGRLMQESLGRYKNINKWIKAIKYHDKKSYNHYIKPIIRYINKPKLGGTYCIKAFDINNGLDIFETASYNSEKLQKTLNEALSNYTQSFRVIIGTNIAMIHINQYIDFIPLRNAINIIKNAKPPNIVHPILEDVDRKNFCKSHFFRNFEKYRVIYNIAEISFDKKILFNVETYMSVWLKARPYYSELLNKTHALIHKQVNLFNGMPFLNTSEASSKDVNDDIDAFFDLLQNVFINRNNAIYFIKYIAWIIQHPGQQSEVIPVLHTSKNTSHIIKHITKIFQNYVYVTSKSIYDKMKCNDKSLYELLCKMLVIIDDDLPLYEDMSNFSTKYQTSKKNYKPSKEFKTFVKKDSNINIKVKGSETLQLKNINNYIVLSSNINSYVKKSKGIKYFIPRLCLSNICKDIKYPSIKTNFNTFYRELTLRFVRMPLKDFDINNVPKFEYNKRIYRRTLHKTNPFNVLIGVLVNLNVLYDKFPIRLIRKIIYEITSVQSYKLLSDVLLCDMKELTFEGERAFSYLFTKFRDVDCEKIISKLNIYFEPAEYSSFNKFLRIHENYGINSNNELDFLRSDKSEKFIKFNANRLQELESWKIEIFKFIKTKIEFESKENTSNDSIESNNLSVSDGSDETKETNPANSSNIAIEIQNDSIVIHLNSMKNNKYISNTE